MHAPHGVAVQRLCTCTCTNPVGVALGAGKWGSDKMSFASLKWVIDGETVLHPTVDQLRHLKRGDYAILMPGTSKADCFGMRWGNNPIWLPFDPEAAINVASALAQCGRSTQA